MNNSSMTADVLVLGFGKAGKTIAMKRAAAGDRVILVEQDPTMHGGTCINIGCIPTKTLLHATAHGMDWPQAQNHRNSFIAKLNKANTAMLEGKGVTIVSGHAAFTGHKEVTVTGGTDTLVITADTIIINTGSTARKATFPGAELPQVMNSTQIQQLQPQPKNLVILGAGPIGLEFATMFAQAGSNVTVINNHADILPFIDADLRSTITEQLAKQNISIQASTEVEKITPTDNGVVVHTSTGDFPADAVLIAIGRLPATEDLGLETGGVEYTDRGITVDEHLQTSIEGVYAVGDVNGGPQFTYVSFDDHRIVCNHRWGDGSRSTKGRIFPTTTFLNPPLSTIGITATEAEKQGIKFEVKAANIADMPMVPRPKIIGNPTGRASFIISEGHILGAQLYCVDSQELINTVAVAMRAGMTATELGAGIYTHPATSEIFNQLLDS